MAGAMANSMATGMGSDLFDLVCAEATKLPNGSSFQSHDSTVSLMSTYSSRVLTGVVLTNATKFCLRENNCYIHTGSVKVPPRLVSPGEREVFVGEGNNLSGSCGVASWQIGQTGWYLFIMWSGSPNFNHYSNWLSIGFKHIKDKDSQDAIANKNMFKCMYYNEESWFKRGEYYDNITRIKITGMNGVVAVGSMGTDHICEARIELLPTSVEYIAPNLDLPVSTKLKDYSKKLNFC